jgi:hypothetical protein
VSGLIGRQAQEIATLAMQPSNILRPAQEVADIQVWEHHKEQTIETAADILDTKRQSLIIARLGQGLFKERVLKTERFCRVTRVEKLEQLRASLCKPWRDATDDERLNGENGLLVSPSIDHLFDRGFISFEEQGRLIISPVAHRESRRKMGVETEIPVDVGPFSSGQQSFLDNHRNSVSLQSLRT